jgi:hypothetical protein
VKLLISWRCKVLVQYHCVHGLLESQQPKNEETGWCIIPQSNMNSYQFP